MGPKILTTLQDPKYSSLDSLCMGPTFSTTVTLESILESLPENLRSLDLDVGRLSEQRRRTSCASRLGPPLHWEQEFQHVWETLPVSLRKLSLRFAKNSNDKAGLLALARTLPHSSSSSLSLETLDLRNNQMDDEVAIALASALSSSPNTIRHVILSFNTIANEGAIALAEALNSSQLISLDLSHNVAIDDAAVGALCRALETNTQLKELNLHGCNISNTGIECLLECLKLSNFSLQRVHLTSRRPIRHDREATTTISTTMDQSTQEERRALLQQLEYWLSLNRAGRQLVVQRGEQGEVPVALWPRVFARESKPNTVLSFKGPHELFFLLKENPSLFDNP